MIKNKNAIIVSPNFYPAIGGAETQVLLMGQELLKRGYCVSVITRKYYPDSLAQENYKGLTVSRFSGSLFKIIPKLFQTNSRDLLIWNGLFKRNDALEIFRQAFITWLAKFIFSKTIFRVPCITKPLLENNLSKMLFLFSIDKWITINRNQFSELLSGGIPKNKLIAPPNLLIRPEVFINKRRPNKKPTIIFCGRTIDLKGLDTLVTSFKYLPKNSFRLVLLLSIPIKYPLECQRNLKLLNTIPFPIEIKFDETDISTYLQKCDIGIFPSNQEGGGNVLREMMAAGVATVSSDIQATLETITDKKDGLIFKTGDPKDLAEKIKILIQNPRLRESIGINARNRAKEISNPEVIISKILR